MDNFNFLFVYMYSILVYVFKMDFLSYEFILGGGFIFIRGIFGNVFKLCDMLCVAFGRALDISFLGGSDGNVFIWKDFIF